MEKLQYLSLVSKVGMHSRRARGDGLHFLIFLLHRPSPPPLILVLGLDPPPLVPCTLLTGLQ